MTELNWQPNYNHAHTKQPPKTILTATDKETVRIYKRLKNFLSIEIYPSAPAANWPKNKELLHRHLFTENGFHHAVRWRPSLKKGWRRLTYNEFCKWYGIPDN